MEGLEVPIISAQGASSTAAFEAIAQDNFYAFAYGTEATEGSELFALAEKHGYTEYIFGPFYPIGFAQVHYAKAVLEECGLPCALADFQTTAHGFDPVEIPVSALYGPVNFTEEQHAGMTAGQLYHWTAADGRQPVGTPFQLQ